MGLFVVLEGVDCGGKSTLIKGLVTQIKKANLTCVTTFEPGKTDAGQKLRSLVLDPSISLFPETEFLLFLADRYQHFNSFVQPSLQKFDVVICDRYFYSTFVYQCFIRNVN